jgi:hypothetical protein
MLVVGLGLITAVFDPLGRVNWYSYKPAGWVVEDLTSATPSVRDRAWDELASRRAANRLSSAAQGKLDATVVRLYATAAGLPAPMRDYLTERFPVLPTDQQSAVFRQLLAALTSRNSLDFDDAGRCLAGLEKAGRLGSGHHAQLAQTGLAMQADRSQRRALGWFMDYLGRRELAGELTPAERDQFFNGCFRPSLEVRPLVAAGDSVPFRVRMGGRGPEANWWSRVGMSSTQVDDLPPVLQGGSIGSSRLSGGGSIGSFIRLDAPGKHQLKVTMELVASDGPYPDSVRKTPPRWSRQVAFTRPFEILPAGAPSPIDWVDEASLAAAIRKSIELGSVRASANSYDAFAMMVKIENSPVNLAFEIFARDAGAKEHPVGRVTAFAGTRENHGVNQREFPPGPNVGTVDVIFRSSERVVKGTTDLYRVWRGEIVIPNVVVKAEKD